MNIFNLIVLEIGETLENPIQDTLFLQMCVTQKWVETLRTLNAPNVEPATSLAEDGK